MQINSSASVSYHRFRVTSQVCVADTKQPVATIEQPTISAKWRSTQRRNKNRAARILWPPTRPNDHSKLQDDRLPLIVVRKRSSLTSFHPTPHGSSSLLQVSINSEEVHSGVELRD